MLEKFNLGDSVCVSWEAEEYGGSHGGKVGIIERGQVEIVKVIFNNPATIVFWADGKKTVVKCADNETFDEEKGLAMAISKRVLGNKGNYYNEFNKWLSDDVLHDCCTCKFKNVGTLEEPCINCTMEDDKWENRRKN